MNYKTSTNHFSIEITSKMSFFPQSGGKIIINNRELWEWIKDNYIAYRDDERIIKTLFIDAEFRKIINILFKAIKDIELNNNDSISSNHIADYFFNHFKPIWFPEPNLYNSFIEVELWNNLLMEVKKWEDENHFKMKKGTPFYFNAGNYLEIGHFDFAFNYAHKAIEDDKIHGKKQDSTYDYHNSPAFFFASLNVDRTNNYLWNKVKSLVIKLEQFIRGYNFMFNRNINFQTIKNKFLTKYADFENEIYYFVYLLGFLTYESYNIEMLELYDNDFAKIRNLDYIFSFCLLLDKIMYKITNDEYISGSTYYFIEKLIGSTLSDTDKFNIKNRIKWNDTSPELIIKAIKYMLSHNVKLFPYNSVYTKQINKKIINSMLIYFLRNRGAHDLKLVYLNTKLFDKIKRALFFQLFIIIEDLF